MSPLRAIWALPLLLLLLLRFLHCGVHAQAPACSTPVRFSVTDLAHELPQLLIELGTWVGNITCFVGGLDGQPFVPVRDNVRFELNSTLDAARSRIVSCSAVGSEPALCRALYPALDGSGKYCIAEPADEAEFGRPRFRTSQAINRRLAVDSAWSQDDELASGGLNYYESGNNAISGYYGVWAPGARGDRPPAVQCLYRVVRTCLGPSCFALPGDDAVPLAF